jgi:glycosyltransferase involved in cell wall biosynthesis
MVRPIAFAVPGDLNAPTGGYAYDRRMIAELEQIGWHVEILNLGEGFPWPSDETRTSAVALLLAVPNGDTIVVDGLAFGALPGAGLNLRANHPLIALVHHPLALESGFSAQQIVTLHDSERTALAAATRVVVTSGATARCLVADYGVPRDHIVIAPPGVDRAPTARGNVDGVVQLLSVGAVVPRKGYDVLVASLATLSELRWHLSIAGNLHANPEAAAALEKDIARFRLGARITLFGAVPQARLVELYANADAFVLASRFEGYGIAYAEAIARGLPVIGTTAGAIPDTVPAGASVLVSPNDEIALAHALRRVITEPHERAKLAACARKAASQLPNWQDSAKILAHVIESVA